MAKQRVKLRVSQGGHHIPEDVIERRYDLGINYFFEYVALVDRWYIYENDEKSPSLIARGEMPNIITILNESLWKKLKNM